MTGILNVQKMDVTLFSNSAVFLSQKPILPELSMHFISIVRLSQGPSGAPHTLIEWIVRAPNLRGGLQANIKVARRETAVNAQSTPTN